MSKKTLNKKNDTTVSAKKDVTEIGDVIVDNTIVNEDSDKSNEDVIIDFENEKDNGDIIVNEEVESAPMQNESNVKNTKAKFAKDYHCIVAGKYYDFKKGKTYTIPTNVKMVLSRANGVLDPM